MTFPLWLRLVLAAFITVTLATGIAAAAILPSTGWDAFTNWAMRSQQSFAAGEFLTTGVVQPQYPVLLHLTQMAPQIFFDAWNDRTANIATLVLCLALIAAIFAVLRRDHGTDAALLTLALILGIPLIMVHLRQGYADLPLALFTLLAALLLPRRPVLSAVMIAAAASTKIEGLYIALLPWIVLVLLTNTPGKRRRAFGAIALALALLTPWTIRTLLLDLPLSPHGLHLAWHGEAIPAMLRHLFLFGTFGAHTWLLPPAIGLLLWSNPRTLSPRHAPVLWWGLVSLVIVLSAYLLTDDVEGLLQGDNFARAIITPLVLLTAGVAGAFPRNL